jgi:hypothetical protein
MISRPHGEPGGAAPSVALAGEVVGVPDPAPEDEIADAVREGLGYTWDIECLRSIDAAYQRLEQIGGPEARRLVCQLDVAWCCHLQHELDERMRQTGRLLVERGQQQLWQEVYDQYRRLDVDYVPGSELRWLVEGDQR